MRRKNDGRVPPWKRNVVQRGDALDLLTSLPDASAALAFFDPQHRGVLDKLKFGNEGARQRERSRLPAMSEDYIDACCREIARVLVPSGYCMLWVDTYGLCEAHHLRVADCFKCVDHIAWDNLRMGMGYRTRRRGDNLLVLQKPPITATTWSDRGISSRWPEKVDRKLHPHVKPAGLIKLHDGGGAMMKRRKREPRPPTTPGARHRRQRPEAALHAAVCDHLRLRAKPDVLWLHPANGGTRDIREAARFKRMGVLAGASDLLLWHRGNSFAFELKSPGGRLSDAQLEFLARFNAAGGHGASAEGVDRAIACLEGWGLLVRRRQ